MITNKQKEIITENCIKYFNEAGIVLSGNEKRNIEITDFGLGRINEFGLQLLTYINTERVCAKEMILFTGQICPEHKHPDFEKKLGKEETFRCRWGSAYLYVPGEATINPKANIPQDRRKYYTVWHEVILNPGEQHTIYANTLHWFQAGPQGAIISEFSTQSTDEKDIFTDPMVQRI